MADARAESPGCGASSRTETGMRSDADADHETSDPPVNHVTPANGTTDEQPGWRSAGTPGSIGAVGSFAPASSERCIPIPRFTAYARRTSASPRIVSGRAAPIVRRSTGTSAATSALSDRATAAPGSTRSSVTRRSGPVVVAKPAPRTSSVARLRPSKATSAPFAGSARSADPHTAHARTRASTTPVGGGARRIL